jgi:hypothetical protein
VWDGPGNCLLLCAAAAAEIAGGERTLATLVPQMLAGVRALASVPDHAAVLRRLRKGDGDGAAAMAPNPAAAAALRQLGALGPEVVPAVERLLALGPATLPTRGNGTELAGVFLLLRAVLDLRLPALVRAAGYPANGAGGLLAALAVHWTGRSLHEEVDPALRLLAGTVSHLGETFSRTSDDDPEGAFRFQQALARLLLGQRLIPTPERLRVALVEGVGGPVLLGGDDATHVWPFAAPLASGAEAGSIVQRWSTAWQELTGTALALEVPSPRDCPPQWVAAWDVLAATSSGPPWFATTTALAAQAVVRAWARWLPHLRSPSTSYLLGQLLRRPGWVTQHGQTVEVELPPRPLDVVLRLAGYLEPIEFLPGPEVRAVRFRIRGDE